MSRSKRIGSFRIYFLYINSIKQNTFELGYYIGYTGCTVDDRISSHFNEAKNSKKRTKKLNWLRSKCKEVVSYLILEDNIPTEEEALCREAHYIAIARKSGLSEYIKNGDNGGRGPGRYTQEAIEKQRLCKIGNKWNIGKKHSAETVRRQSESLKGRVLSQESRDKAKATRKEREAENRKNGIFQICRERKFTEEQVLDIFRMFNDELMSVVNISVIYNCPKSTISTVLYHKNAYPDYKLKYNLIAKSKPAGYYKQMRIDHIQKVNAKKFEQPKQ